MTHQAILVASAILLLAFGIERLGQILRIPSVVILIAAGLAGKPALTALGFTIPSLNAIVPLIGTVGLVLIVLEGALDIEFKMERLPAVSRAFVLACGGFAACTLVFALLIGLISSLTPFQAVIMAVPFAVISSAVAIPSSGFLPAHLREFIVYESSISDIVGVLVFFSLLESGGKLGGALAMLAGGGLASLLLAAVCAVGLTLLTLRIEGQIRFVPLLACVFCLYSLGKLWHLSPLFMVLFFGLTLNNSAFFARISGFRRLIDDSHAKTLDEFKLITAEMTFAVRGFFFILLGYWTDLGVLASPLSWAVAIAVLALTYGSRYLLLRLAKVELADTLTWMVPRGLITVLLLLSARDSMSVPAYLDGVVLITVLASATATAIGRLRWDRAAALPIEEETA